jgi:asparagine synthase (glutamine-hydrolysing)
MNVFVCLWNAPESWQAAAVGAVKRMADVLPQLSEETARQFYPQTHGSVDTAAYPVVAAIHTADVALGERTYVAMDGPDLVLYDGAPIDPSGQIAAWSASSLAAHWEALHQRLEGQFVLVRATPRSLQVLTDPLGLYPVYYWHRDRTWLVSNSIAILRSITGERAWDPLGLSMTAVSGWAGADRTLTANIRVMPGGEVWSAQRDAVGLTKHRYFERAELARLSRAATNRADVPGLTRTLRGIVLHASGRGGRLKCALTGGRDTRLLAAFLMAEHIPAQYTTGGDPDSQEVQVAARIAQRYGLEHVVEDGSREAIASRWPQLAWRIVRENDGLVNVWQAHNLAYTPSSVSSLDTFVWGIGGEICRSFYGVPLLRWQGAKPDDVLLRLCGLQTAQVLARPAAQVAVVDHVRRFVQETLDEGFPVEDVPDVYFTYDRLRRASGANLRKYSPTAEVVAPFCGRAYMRAAFQFDALHRWTEPLHYQMLRRLDRRLHRMRFQSGQRRWKSQNAMWNWRRRQLWTAVNVRLPWRARVLFKKRSPYHQVQWLEAHLSHVRQVCLDTPCSDDLWQVLDRDRLESMLHEENREARRRSCHPLFRVVTLSLARAAGVA